MKIIRLVYPMLTGIAISMNVTAQSTETDPCDYQSLTELRSELNDAAEAFANSALVDAIEAAREVQAKCPDSAERIEGFIEAAERRRAKLNAVEDPEPVTLRLPNAGPQENPGTLLRTSLTLSTIGYGLVTTGVIASAQSGEPNLAVLGGVIGSGMAISGLVLHFKAANALEREIKSLKDRKR